MPLGDTTHLCYSAGLFTVTSHLYGMCVAVCFLGKQLGEN